MIPASITPQEVAAVIDRLIPVVQGYRQAHPLPAAFSDPAYPLFMPQTVLLSQYADPQSQFRGQEALVREAWHDLERVLAEPQPQWPAYETAFEIPYLFDCYRAARASCRRRRSANFESCSARWVNVSWRRGRGTS